MGDTPPEPHPSALPPVQPSPAYRRIVAHAGTGRMRRRRQPWNARGDLLADGDRNHEFGVFHLEPQRDPYTASDLKETAVGAGELCFYFAGWRRSRCVGSLARSGRAQPQPQNQPSEGMKESPGCHPERSEGSPQLVLVQVLAKNCGDASPARRDQHDRLEFFHTFSPAGSPISGPRWGRSDPRNRGRCPATAYLPVRQLTEPGEGSVDAPDGPFSTLAGGAKKNPTNSPLPVPCSLFPIPCSLPGPLEQCPRTRSAICRLAVKVSPQILSEWPTTPQLTQSFWSFERNGDISTVSRVVLIWSR
jgi:hypothetical protein